MDTSSISFTALYTGQVWHENELSTPFLTSRIGKLMYQGMRPVELAADRLLGMNLKQLLLQRHLIMDHRIAHLIENEGVSQVLEIACGLSPRGLRMRSRYPQLRYVEADLPAMAARKRDLLASAGQLGEGHHVVACNIFTSGEPDGLDHVMEHQLAADRPTLIITEGLVNYFPTPTMEAFWQSLATRSARFPNAWYLTDLYPHLRSHSAYRYVKLSTWALGKVTSSSVNLHYHGDEDIKAGFQRQGFSNVNLYHPEDYYHRLPIPTSRKPTFVRIVEAKR